MALRRFAAASLVALVVGSTAAGAQNVPAATPYAPQPIVAGGRVIPLFPSGSPFLKMDRVAEPEVYNMAQSVPGRIQSIVNIHNPSIEIHPVDRGINTGAMVVLVAGGGHNTLNVGTEAADFVHFFYNYGVNTAILRNRLRKDGYNAQTDAVYDAQQAVRLIRAHAAELGVDPHKIGIVGFSAGAELAACAAVEYEPFDKANGGAGDPLAGQSSRPDFVGLVYPGPTPFARDPKTPIPPDAPPTFLVSAGSGDAQHAIWADDYFGAFLRARVPNLEMHIYGNGVHANGMKDRNGEPFGTWHERFIDWFRDLGFLQKPGVETKASKDVSAYMAQRKTPTRQ
ncbi:MAG TPA: alpha/beta hydrolase fold domain-containing protein [Vicinamibacterales bacterium]|nr:alpha/beta hydrolase fold domain-containing protein [Vicinamibacterales bacterium]